MQFFRFQEPALGMLFFLAMFLLAKIITDNYVIAMLSALIASFCDVIILYQSEYHPQGLAYIFLVLWIYTYFKYIDINDYRFLVVSFIFGITFLLSHHFTSLYWALMISAYLFILFILNVLSPHFRGKLHFCEEIRNNKNSRKFDYIFLVIFVVFVTAYQFFVYRGAVDWFIWFMNKPSDILNALAGKFKWGLVIAVVSSLIVIYFYKYRIFDKYQIDSTLSLTITKLRKKFDFKFSFIFLIFISITYSIFILINILTGSYVTITLILNSAKYIIFLLALLPIMWILQIKKNIGLCVVIIFAWLIGTIISAKFPTDRVIGFFYIFSSVFVASSLFRFRNHLQIDRYRDITFIFIILIVSLIITSGFLNSQTPSYFFHDSGENTIYWYSNRLPTNMEEYRTTGEWSGKFISKERIISTEFDTLTSAFYFGCRNINYVNQDINYSNYIMLNPFIPYEGSQKNDFHKKYDIIYTTKELRIFKT
jgi:hypothetical protein